MRHSQVVGDMQINGDGTVDGWCWAPERPRARIAFEILIDDRVVGHGRAALPRPDLAVPGMADARHGFWLALPPGAIDPALSCLVSARARDGGQVFGRRRLDPERATADPTLLAMEAALGELSERLAAFWQPPRSAGLRLRRAARSLAGRLGRPASGGADDPHPGPLPQGDGDLLPLPEGEGRGEGAARPPNSPQSASIAAVLEPPPFDAGSQVRFPARGFVSLAEFDADAERDAARLSRQARIEAALATADPVLHERASCAPCLRPAALRSATLGGRATESGRHLPDWATEQVCDCEDALCGRDRALLHAALSVGGLRRWSRLLLFGPPTALHRRLRDAAGETLSVADLSPGPTLAAPEAAAELIVAADCLHRLPALRPVLAELRRVAAPGGCLLARVPFRARAAASAHRRPIVAGPRLSPGELHAIGWDILPMLREAGWEHAEVLHYWSRELGYLGADNYLLRAVA